MLRRLTLLVSLLVCLSAAGSAQLELPKHAPPKPVAPKPASPPPEAGQGGAPEDGSPQTEAPRVEPGSRPAQGIDLDGKQRARTLRSSGDRARERGDGLELPAPPAARPDPAPPGDATGPAGVTGSPGAPGRGPAREATAAEFLLAELGRIGPEDFGHRLVGHTERSLFALGDEGLAAARQALFEEHPPTVLVAARVLLRSGRAAEGDLVLTRLSERLPRQLGPVLLDALLELDPVRASPGYLAELLGHPQSTLRTAAQRVLAEQSGPAMLGALLGALEHDLTDTRLRAVQLVSGVRDPAVLPLLLQRLKDRSSLVASRAVSSLAALDDERVADELLRRAFGMRWILREGAYALLAIVEREDRSMTPILNDSHVDPLLGGLDTNDAFVSGACAVALAGIGFRSELPATWLDRRVPHRLVRVVGGEEFHNDYSALQPVALRRLALLTGEHFGSDGPTWMRWWAGVAEGFTARRAVLRATPEDAPRLSVHVRSTLGLPTGFRLIGEQAPESAAALEMETLRMTASQARELFDVLAEEGVFGIQRLPGPRGDVGGGARELEVAIGSARKGFSFARDRGEPWFERVLATAEAVRDTNRWQRFLPAADPADRRTQWLLEASWWEGEPDPGARDERLKRLVLDQLATRRPSERDDGAAELARLFEGGCLAQAADFGPLMDLLRSEFFIGPRARTFIRGALDAARSAGSQRTAPASDAGVGEALPAPELVRELVDVLLEGFGPEAARELSEVLAAAGRGVTHEAAEDPRPFVRAVAAATLARDASEADYAVLERLLSDSEPAVEVATVLALGDHRVEAARTELLVRARVAEPEVRAAALQSIGRLGGEGAFDALLVGLAEREDEAVAVAAAEGLAELADPSSAPLFVSILAKGEAHPAHDAARRGLLRLGPVAFDALLRVVHASGHRARREAALILARQGVPEVASSLMAMLTETPDDLRVAEELAVLTCVDFRDQPDPAVAWWTWWEQVVHDDPNAWLVAALERAGVPAIGLGELPAQPPEPASPARDGSEPAGPEPAGSEAAGPTRAGALYLLEAIAVGEPHVAERARRVLDAWLAQAPADGAAGAGAARGGAGAPPTGEAERREWLRTLRERVEARYK